MMESSNHMSTKPHGKLGASRVNYRNLRTAAIIFMFSLTLYAYISVRDNFLGLLSDAYIYLLLADFFSPWSTLDIDLALSLFRSYPYPPGYPLLLAALGGGSQHGSFNYWIDAVLLAAAIAAYFLWLRRQNEPLLVAGLLALSFATMPATLLSSMGLLSEHPYLLGILLAALCLTNTRLKYATVCAALLIGICTLIRSVGLAAGFALFVHAFPRITIRHTLLLVFCTVAFFAFWLLVKQIFHLDVGYFGSINYAFSDKPVTNLVHQLEINTQAFWLSFVSSFRTTENIVAKLACAGLLCSAGIGFYKRFRDRQFDAIYVAAYCGILAVWPYPEHFQRFIFVIMPFVLYYALLGSRAIARISRSPIDELAICSIFFALVILMLLPTTLNIFNTVRNYSDKATYGLVRTPQWHRLPNKDVPSTMHQLARIVHSVGEIQLAVPTHACVTSVESHLVQFYAKRISQKPLPNQVNKRTFEIQLDKCPYIFMVAAQSSPPSGYPPMYPYHRITEHMDVLQVSYFDEHDQSDYTVLTMLAKARTGKNDD